MTIRGFFIFSFIQWLLISVLKVIFFRADLIGNMGLQHILYWVLVGVITAAMVRRLGIMNFLESVFIIFVWVLGDLFSDLVITSAYTGVGIFTGWTLWTGCIVQVVTIFFFHKKRHIVIRQQQHGHGAHGGGHH
jgi:hypothetical protein